MAADPCSANSVVSRFRPKAGEPRDADITPNVRANTVKAGVSSLNGHPDTGFNAYPHTIKPAHQAFAAARL